MEHKQMTSREMGMATYNKDNYHFKHITPECPQGKIAT